MKIIVNTKEEKEKLLKESQYIHDFKFFGTGEIIGLDSDKANTLMHIHMNPDMIIIDDEKFKIKGFWPEPKKLKTIPFHKEQFDFDYIEELPKSKISQEDLNKYVYEYNGNKHCVSPMLLNQKKAWHNLDKIKELHIERLSIYDDMILCTDNIKLKELANDVTKTEFKLQKLWGFPQDENFHRWFDVPKCTCPKMDNAERLGTEYRIINEDCPIHGN